MTWLPGLNSLESFLVMKTPTKKEYNPLFLIAMPQLMDPNFARSVVLLLHHSDEGAIGLIVNNPYSVNLGSFARQGGYICHPNLEKVPVYCGGPADYQRGWTIHSDETLEEKEVLMPGLFLSSSPESLIKLLEKGEKRFRLVLGYAGWGPGQLKRESVEGSWLMAPVNLQHILYTAPHDTWNAVLQDLGADPSRIAPTHGIH
jgi:putative transcriptional regulator